MRILAVNWRDIKNPEAGGAEVYLHEILKRLVSKGHEVILISSKYKECRNKEIVDGVKIVRVGNKYFFNFVFFWYYISKLRNENFDIVIDSVSKIPLCIPLYVKKQILSIVYHIHGKTLFRELPLFIALYVYLMERLLIPVFYKESAIITISESTKDELAKFGIPSKNILVIYCGIENKFGPSYKADIPMILYFGRVKKYKRIDNVIKAFKHIKEKIPEAKLIIAGKGDNYKELITLSKELGISDSINFVGEVSEEEKVKLLQKAWVFVTTSEKEGWGITVIEANACGTPVISYDVHGLRDSVKHSYNGLLVEDGNIKALAETIIGLLENNNLREELSKNAIEWAKQFSWDRSAEEFERTIFNSLEHNLIKK
jgi:glycosyltransferase involved in cell wall biosynthesis